MYDTSAQWMYQIQIDLKKFQALKGALKGKCNNQNILLYHIRTYICGQKFLVV